MWLLSACAAPDLEGFFVDLGGKVVDIDGAAVAGADIRLETPDGDEVGDAETDATGSWSFPVYGTTLDNNSLVGTISASGYAETRSTWEINLMSPEVDHLRQGPGETWSGVARTLSPVVMAPAADRATVAGAVVDATTGAPMSGVSIALQFGANAPVGAAAVASASTDGDGRFSLELDTPGAYTVFATGPAGYDTARFAAMALADGGWSRGALVPTLEPGQAVASLGWTTTPADLDLHLSAPLSGDVVGSDHNGQYHVWPGEPSHPDDLVGGADLEATMLRTDEDGIGPETVMVYSMPGPGELRLTVVDNGSLGDSRSTALAASRATLQVWNGEDTPRYWTVGPGTPAVAWHPVTIAVPEATVYVLEEYLGEIDPSDAEDF